MHQHHIGALQRRHVRHFDVGGEVAAGPQAPGLSTNQYGVPTFTAGGLPSGSAQIGNQPGALGSTLGTGGGSIQGPNTGTGLSGPGIGGTSITGRDIATFAGSTALGALGTMLGGPLLGIAASLAGKYGVGALVDYFDPPTTPGPPAPQTEPTAAIGAGLGAGSTLSGAMSNVGGISTADPTTMGDITGAGGLGSGGVGEIGGGNTNSGGSQDEPGLGGGHARGGGIRRRSGALGRRLGAKR